MRHSPPISKIRILTSCRCRSRRSRISSEWPCRIAQGSMPYGGPTRHRAGGIIRSEEHTSELQSLMRTSYAVFCLNKKNTTKTNKIEQQKYNKIENQNSNTDS